MSKKKKKRKKEEEGGGLREISNWCQDTEFEEVMNGCDRDGLAAMVAWVGFHILTSYPEKSEEKVTGH